ncbi:CynX/NimT family MFS transporter [Streptomyces sp. SID5770]|uniref:CynX/NimT family MFS transporter n=1 Tax=unclassified Streptomyces TaxID=2593676 RepID=UPI000EF7AB48|nr:MULTISPECIES: MFS transporter [unclassified Streptomyces]MZE54599.1 CynX/NimT family MFS transporter [Streptomyces sp. SID5770]
MPDEPKTLDPAARPAATAGDSPAPDRNRRADGAAPSRTRFLVPVTVGLVLAALNLRPAITSLGALLEEVSEGLHMSGSVAGVLTSVPPLCFAVFGITAPRLARRFGPAAVVCAGMAAIFTGLLLRPLAGGTAGFLAASALALMGIAVSNVLMPVIVKRYFPDRVGTMTGLYSMALALGTSVAAAATVPLTGALGGNWRLGLGVWAVLAALAVLPWLPLLRDRDRDRVSRTGTGPSRTETDRPSRAETGPSRTGAPVSRTEAKAPAPDAAPRVTRSRTAWALGAFFGLQATGAYITMGWMPQIFRDAGVPASTAGVLLAVTMVMGVPLAFVIPRLATRMKTQGPIVVALALCGLGGYTGLLLAPAAGAWVWAVLLGVSNCAFPLALTMIGMRSRTGAGVVRLSAFAQSVGYLISIPGPLLVGVLYQHSGGWGLPIALMGGLMVPQMIVGILAGRDRTVEDEC